MFSIKYQKAFSVIEIAVVLVIMGVIIAGIISVRGSLVERANNNRINEFTNTSLLNEMPNLAIWLDVGVARSFKDGEMNYGQEISKLNNISPENYHNFNFEQATTSSQPIYEKDQYDAMPSLNFADDDSLEANLSDYNLLQPKQVTVFLVQNIIDNDGHSFYWEPSLSEKFSLENVRKSSNSQLNWNFSDGIVSTTIDGFINKWNIITLVRSTDGNGIIRVNGAQEVASSIGSNFATGTSDTLKIGNSLDFSLREFIVFNKQLNEQEINDVEDYLAKKWDIEISN